MTILFSTTKPACQPPARIYFEAPDDALLARVTEKVAELMGRHLSYTFHDEAPGGVTPIILEDVGPTGRAVGPTVVNYPHAACRVPVQLFTFDGSLQEREVNYVNCKRCLRAMAEHQKDPS